MNTKSTIQTQTNVSIHSIYVRQQLPHAPILLNINVNVFSAYERSSVNKISSICLFVLSIFLWKPDRCKYRSIVIFQIWMSRYSVMKSWVPAFGNNVHIIFYLFIVIVKSRKKNRFLIFYRSLLFHGKLTPSKALCLKAVCCKYLLTLWKWRIHFD